VRPQPGRLRLRVNNSPTALDQLVAQFLLGRVDGLGAPQVAAFVSGWSSALELVRRTDLTIPLASQEVKRAVDRLVEAIERARETALADPD
jgi:hypothetical protein